MAMSKFAENNLRWQVKDTKRQLKEMTRQLLPHPAAAFLDSLLKGEQITVGDKTYVWRDNDIYRLMKSQVTGTYSIIPIKTSMKVSDLVKKFKELSSEAVLQRGIYATSKIRHASLWKELRASGIPIISPWIDEAGPGESSDLSDLWVRCVREASKAACVVVYCEEGDLLKGGYVEIGAALTCGVPILAVGMPEELTILHHPLVKIMPDLKSAIDQAVEIVRSGRLRDSV